MNRLLGVLVVGLFVSVSFATVIPAQKDHVVSLDGMWRFKLEQAKGKYDQRGETGILPIDYPPTIAPTPLPRPLPGVPGRGSWQLRTLISKDA